MMALFGIFVVFCGAVGFCFIIRKVMLIHWGSISPDEEENVQGKVVVITGAGSGIGFETAVEMAKRRATVIVTGRNLQAARDTEINIRNRTFLGKVIPLVVDLSSLMSVEAFSKDVFKCVEKIDVLINNAGVLIPVDQRQTTQDGFEMHFGIHHLSHFYLTNLLLPLLKKGQSSRIVVLTSFSHRGVKLNWGDLNYEKTEVVQKTMEDNELYKASKLANILFVKELSRRFQDKGIKINVYACCPGIVATNISRNLSLPWYSTALYPLLTRTLFKTPIEGCATTLYCALSKKCRHETGLMYRNCTRWEDVKCAYPDDLIHPIVPTTYSVEDCERLWKESEKLCNIRFIV